MDKLTIVCNDLLLQSINAWDRDRIEELSKFSTRHKITIDKRVVDAAKSIGLLCVEILFSYAYNAISTFIEYMSPDDNSVIFRIAVRYNANIDTIIYNAVTRECYSVIDMLIISMNTNEYKIFDVAFSQNKTNTIKYLRENCIREKRDIYFLFESAYLNLKFDIIKYCINECNEYRDSFLSLIDKSLLLRLYINEHSYSLVECISLLLNRGTDIDLLYDCFPDIMLLLLYKMGVSYFGKFTKRMGILLIEEYSIREEIRETIPELPDEITNLITGY